MKYLKIQNRDFYDCDTITVAKNLLGKVLVHERKEGICSGIITETEAYCGVNDQACHSYNNRRTKRTETMYSIGGTLYVYMVYGMYYCANVVTKNPDEPEAVLIRSIEPLEGLDLMKKRRVSNRKTKLHTKIKDTTLCNGPGKLTQAFGITKEHNGLDLCNSHLYIAKMTSPFTFTILKRPRIGIDYAGDAKNFLWRFAIKNNPHVSKL